MPLQEYIVANPQHLELVKMHLERARRSTKEPERLIINRWFKVALVSNMPWMIFDVIPRFSRYVFEEPCIWTGITFQGNIKVKYSKRSISIDNSEKVVEIFTVYSIQFAMVPMIITSIGNKIAPTKRTFIIIYAKFMLLRFFGQQMTLFYKSLPHAMPFIMSELQNLTQWSNGVNDDCLAMHKFIFDVHENCLDSCLQILYDRTNFLNIVSRYYRIEFIKLNGK